jgi:hypothetical protein
MARFSISANITANEIEKGGVALCETLSIIGIVKIGQAPASLGSCRSRP